MTYRNPKILAEARNHPCQYCGTDDGTVVAAHSNSQSHGKGMGIKAADTYVAYLCARCHEFVDRGASTRSLREVVWHEAHIKSVPLFWHLLDTEGKLLLMKVDS